MSTEGLTGKIELRLQIPPDGNVDETSYSDCAKCGHFLFSFCGERLRNVHRFITHLLHSHDSAHQLNLFYCEVSVAVTLVGVYCNPLFPPGFAFVETSDQVKLLITANIEFSLYSFNTANSRATVRGHCRVDRRLFHARQFSRAWRKF